MLYRVVYTQSLMIISAVDYHHLRHHRCRRVAITKALINFLVGN